MLKTLLKPLASLRLTVVLLALSMFLVYAGTWAQVSLSNWDAQNQYFYSTWVLIPLSIFFSRIAEDGKTIPDRFIWSFLALFAIGFMFLGYKLVNAATTAGRVLYGGIAAASLGLLIYWKLDHGRPLPQTIPMPGGYTLGLLLLINLLAAHSLRFKMTWRDIALVPGIALFTWLYYTTRHSSNGSALFLAAAGVPFLVPLIALHRKRSGIILIHLGLILLLVGEGISSHLKVESKMDIDQGGYANYTYDVRDVELAISDTSPTDHDNVTVISADRLSQLGTVKSPALPFELKIDRYFENTGLVRADEVGRTATAGVAADTGLEVRAIPKFAGTGETASLVDTPSVYVTPIAPDGKPIEGTFLCTTVVRSGDRAQLNNPQPFQFQGKTYTLHLRWKRDYKPYTIYLKKFSFDRYTGTDVARNYSSDIRFVDSAQGEDRMVHIWMNHPLRYKGETFFQADFDHATEHGTVLQVVRNPAWRLPYVACVIGGAGLLLHFGMVLAGFIRKQSKRTRTMPAPAPTYMTAKSNGGNKKKRRQDTGPAAPLPTNPIEIPPTTVTWRDVGVPAVVGLIAVIYLIGQLVAPPRPGNFDVRTFSQLPVAENGRVQPWDSVARVTLRSISGKDYLQARVADDGSLTPIVGNEPFFVTTKKIPAADWLLDVLFAPEKAAKKYKPFRVDYPELAGRLSIEPGEKFFSLDQFLFRWDELAPQIYKAYKAHEDGHQLSDYQTKLLELSEKVRLYLKVAGPENIADYHAFRVDGRELRQFLQLPDDGLGLFSKRDLLAGDKAQRLLQLTRSDGADPSNGGLSELRDQADDLIKSIDFFEGMMCRQEGLRIVPPQRAGDDWVSIQAAQRQGAAAVQPIVYYAELREAYESDLPSRFNSVATTFYTSLEKQVPRQADKASFEAGFNTYDPFLKCIVFYVAAFTLVCLSWLPVSWRAIPYRSAAALIVVALVVHTAGLIGRIYISGRPPVTNLTSASIFIAWGALLLALGVEYFFRNSIGLLVAAAAGFCSLLLSEGLTVQEGDTLKVLQAVLDTNFWLATHVVCVTLGYAATFLAGLLGIVYIIRGLFTPMSKDDGREIARMIYGVVCFAMFFSFVGTVLGGIWADQSWGRFWGWDSKENGAVLVVLTNAILLHSRWAGIVRERGIAVLAVWGIMVTQWSFFGTNQLGIGLHAYGFTEGLWAKLLLFWGVELGFIVMGLVPMRHWMSAETEA
jgi:ABC-type transport system involved in cytochrome c biogenesis permease subunit